YFCPPTHHTHAPNPEKTTYQKRIGDLRSAALSSTLAPRHIISETTRILSPNISAILPEYNTLQRNIQKIQQRANMPYPFPRSASDLIIPYEFKDKFREEPFAVADILSESGERTLASINSFNQRNPLCELTECFLHLSQCMWRKIQEKGLSTFYVNNHLLRKNIKMFLSHAFCRPESVLHCFESFENYLIEKVQMDTIMEIFKYFEDNFIGRLHRNI
ncbi:hypothetical protein HZS_6372, partial [Henneguya salminicola]